MKKTQPTLLGSSGKIPKSRLKSLLLIGFLVLVLPLLALAAKMAVDLSSRAYLPPSADSVCRAALTKHNFERPCRPTATPTPQPRRGEKTVAKRPTIQPTSYSVIKFTCVDGYTETYEVKSCMPEERLLTYAYSVCDQHSLVKQFQYNDACKLPVRRGVRTSRQQDQEAQRGFDKGFKRVKFTCADGFDGEYTTSCRTEEQLRNYVYSTCKTHSICPTRPTPTPTKPTGTLTPTMPTPTATTSGNLAPVIMTTSLPSGFLNQRYQEGIVATDKDGDTVKMSLSNLPAGLSTGPCSVPAGGRNTITCYIYGTPTKVGTFFITAVALDSRGGTTKSEIKLLISSGELTPTPTRYDSPTQ